ncbi:Transporter of the ATP-binding cassette (ABC), partial [Coemansia biformis]
PECVGIYSDSSDVGGDGGNDGGSDADLDALLVEDEMRLHGLVKLDTWRLYLRLCCGWQFVAGCLGTIVVMQLLGMFKDYCLARQLSGGTAPDGAPGADTDVLRALAVYLGLGVLSAAVSALALLWAYAGGLRSAQALHERLVEAVVYATPRFLDTTPVGRIMVRFAKDVQVVDEDITEILFSCIRSCVLVAITLAAISAAIPQFAAVGLAVLGAYARLMWRFMQAQRETSRLEATSYAPVVSLYGEMTPGSASIRAFAMQAAYLRELEQRAAAHIRAELAGRAQTRWLDVRMALASALASFATAVFVLLRARAIGTGLAGFIFVYAVSFWVESTAAVRAYSYLELLLNCVERAHQYVGVAREAPAAVAADDALPPGWPRTGALAVAGLVAGYVGVVGRTGAGKSTLMQALLRLLEASAGRVVLDGVDIAGVGLARLRLGVTIVPQDPVLFNGTVRFNLDPFGDHPDALLLDALRRTLLLRGPPGSAGTSASVAAFGSLDDAVTESGRNLSLGQRQLVALARALVRRSRLVVMDEATA